MEQYIGILITTANDFIHLSCINVGQKNCALMNYNTLGQDWHKKVRSYTQCVELILFPFDPL